MTVVRPSHLYNGNPYTQIDGRCIETGTKFRKRPSWLVFRGVPWRRRTRQINRRLHGRNLVAIGLSVWYEIWLPFGWHHLFVIGWPRYNLWLPQLQWIVGSRDQWEFLPFFTGHWQSPCTALMADNLPAVSAVQRYCERVYQINTSRACGRKRRVCRISVGILLSRSRSNDEKKFN